jgi:hypothetical protein
MRRRLKVVCNSYGNVELQVSSATVYIKVKVLIKNATTVMSMKAEKSKI